MAMKGLPGPGLLAHVAVSKYEDHLPPNRLERVLERAGLDIARSTVCDWVRHVADLLEGVWRRMKTDVLLSHIIQTDDTPVQVQDEKREALRKSRLWVYLGDHEHPCVVFDYTPKTTCFPVSPKQLILGHINRARACVDYQGFTAVVPAALLGQRSRALCCVCNFITHSRALWFLRGSARSRCLFLQTTVLCRTPRRIELSHD